MIFMTSYVAAVRATKLSGNTAVFASGCVDLTPLTERLAMSAVILWGLGDREVRWGNLSAHACSSARSSNVRVRQGSGSTWEGMGFAKKVRRLPFVWQRLMQWGVLRMMSARSWCAFRGML